MLEVFRKEIKYITTAGEFARIGHALRAVLDLDPNCRDGKPYCIRTLYFDSMDDSDLRDVIDGSYNKQKVRLRTYAPDFRSIKLEYKCKSGSDGLKQSLPVTRAQAERLMQGDYGVLSESPGKLAAELFARMKAGCYLPRTVVEYSRMAFMKETNDIRITFDSNVSAAEHAGALFRPDAPFHPLMPPGVGVLEVKYTGFLFSYLKELLEPLGETQSANSKYAAARMVL